MTEQVTEVTEAPETTEKTKSKAPVYLRRFVAIAALLICLIIPLSFLEHYFCIPATIDQTRVIQFEKEPENSIDVLMLGSSPTYSGFASAYAYGKYGFTSYPYAIGGSSYSMWKPAVQNALRTQKPKLVVIDIFGGGYDLETAENRKLALYLTSNAMPFSLEKVKMAVEASKNMDVGDAVSLTFPIVRYHSNVPGNIRNYKERFAIEDYGPSPMKGIEFITKAKELDPLDEECFTTETEPLDKKTEEAIISFIDYCNEQGIDMLFVKYPSVLLYNDDFMANKRQNSVLKLVEEHGCRTLDLENKFYDIGLVEKSDFYNRGHTNNRGQKKITDYLGAYIQKEMGIGPSELDENVKAEWDKAADYYDALYDLAEEKIANGKKTTLGESPELVDEVEEFIASKE